MSWMKLRLWLWRMRRRIGVWGYIIEASVYLRALFRRQHSETRFVIFAQGRTGSELLCGLLDSHSKIHCDKEILNQPVFLPHRLIRCYAALAAGQAYGFKVKINQLTERQKIHDVKAFLTRLGEEGWKIIYLSRRNLLRHALSDALRIQSRKAHRYRTDNGEQPRVEKIQVDCDYLRERMEMRVALLAEEKEVLADIDCLRIVYDDDLYTGKQQQETLRRVFEWLDLEFERPTTDLVRNTPKGIADLVANNDELVNSLSGTEFAEFLEEQPAQA